MLFTPKMHSLTLKTWEKSSSNIEIRPNLSYSVSRGLVTGLAVPKAPHLIMPCTKSTLHPLPTPQNNEPVPQALKQVVNLSFLNGPDHLKVGPFKNRPRRIPDFEGSFLDPHCISNDFEHFQILPP